MSEFELQPVIPLDEKPLTGEHLKNLKSIQMGAGVTQFLANAGQGIALGGDSFDTATFKVDMDGKVTATEMVDSTYGFRVAVVKQLEVVNWTNTPIEICDDFGGLLTVSANYKQAPTQYFLWLDPVGHFYTYKSGGKYYIYHAGVAIQADKNADAVYYTIIFNSLESGQGY